MLGKRTLTIAAAGLLAVSGFAAPPTLAPEVKERALKVIALLEGLEKDRARHPERPGGSGAVAEADVNAWIAYRIATEGESYVRSCELRLLDGDRAEGKLVIDLSRTPASTVLPAQAEVFFAASAETRDGKIRIIMERLFLGTQSLPPSFLDTVIGIVAGLEGQPAQSLRDWYPLPYGIRRLESRAGRLICHY
ncbi:MAG TPA: hypothetical protein VMS75_00805 [Terriglobales bacterium]|nr:hypothetical protein [Terriglobales bacterium]